MASLKDIRVRIESTRNTQQITKAMKLVSAAKLRKAQHQIVNMRPFSHALLKIIANIAVSGRAQHPLLEAPEETKNVLLVVISSDRGLCGAFNSQINRFAENYLREKKANYEKMELIFIGRRVLDFFGRRGITPVESITRLDKDVSFQMATEISEKLLKQFLAGDYHEVRFIYNEFKSAISQKVVCESLLPVDLTKQDIVTNEDGQVGFAADLIFEPAPEEMMEDLLHRHFAMQVYRCLCESVAAEHGARMSAMENASNNAKEVLGRLTLTYNKLRQEKITTELIEIVSGAEAL